MDNLSKQYKQELFEYYKSKCHLINVKNKKNYDVKNFIKVLNIEEEKLEIIKNIIVSPIITHEAYEDYWGRFYFKAYNFSSNSNNFDNILYDMFKFDIKEKHPMYGLIEGCGEYYIDELKYEYNKYKIKKKIRGF